MNIDGILPAISRPKVDSKILEASRNARNTFRFFWREVAWEKKRIVPGLDLACIKLSFCDLDSPEQIEHMWISDIGFDGKTIKGKLANQPGHLKTFERGQEVETSLDQIEDWLFAIDGKAYGGFSIQMIRSQMSPNARRKHDACWGLDFDTENDKNLLFPGDYIRKIGLPESIFREDHGSEVDHPMSIAVEAKFADILSQYRDHLDIQDNNGWTMLHHEALAGNRIGVGHLLANGADKSIKTHLGMTALDLAETLGWESVVSQLTKHGAD